MLDEGKKYLAVEITRTTLSVLEFIPDTRPLQVTNFVTARKPGGEPAEVARFLKKMAEDAGITGVKTLVIINEPVIEHRTYLLPKVAREERDILIMRRLEADVATSLSELSVASTVIGETPDKGVDKDEVLVVTTPAFEVKRALYIVIEAGFEPLLMTSFPVASSAVQGSDDTESFVSFVRLSDGKSFVTVSKGGKLQFSREFYIDFEDVADSDEIMDYQNIGETEEIPGSKVVEERIVTELSRSFLYFKQFSRGETVRKTYLMGERAEGTIGEIVADRFAMEVEKPEMLLSGRFVLSDQALEKKDDFDVSHFAHLVALAAEGKKGEDINLLPQAYLERKRRLLRQTVFVGAAAIYLLVNLILGISFMSAKSHYTNVLQEIDGLGPAVDKNREYADAIYTLQRRANESEAILNELEHPFKRWVECFGFLSQVTPGSVTFDDLNIQKENERYLWKLSGRTAGATPEKVQLEFNRFFSSLKQNPFLDAARYIPVVVYPVQGFRHQYEEKFILELNVGGARSG